MQNDSPKLEPLHVILTRTMFSPFFTLYTPVNEHSEELESDEVKQWFKDHGANMDAVDKAVDTCWNFLRAEVYIRNPKRPPMPNLPYMPDI